MRLPSSLLFLAVSALMLTACDRPSGTPASEKQPAPPVAPPPYPGPAMWLVEDADTRIYLFGTFHMLRPGTGWFQGPIRRAFDASDTLVTEIIQPADPMALAPVTIALATDPDGPPLSQKLAPSARQAFVDFAAANGLKSASLERYEAWYVASALATARYRKLGLDPKSGAERTLVAALPATKKHEALETPQAQLAMLDSVPESEQIDSLAQLVTSKGDPRAAVDSMLKLWLAGDIDRLAATKNAALYKQQAMARIMLFERNQRWAAWIKQRMARPGTVFVAVGGSHLAGPKNVREYLASEQGLTARRVSH